MTGPRSGADLLKKADRKPRRESTVICLRPDLIEEFYRLESELASESAGGTGKRLAHPDRAKERAAAENKATRLKEIEEAIEAAQATFVFEQLPLPKFNALTANHPPRPGDAFDQMSGYNRDEVLDALVRECMVDPVFEDCAVSGCEHTDCGSWQQFLSTCNQGEWRELRDTVNVANQAVVDNPKSVLASQILERRATD